jgi:hypothetical protein
VPSVDTFERELALNRGNVGVLEKIDIGLPVSQVFSAAMQHPSLSHPLLDLTLISQHPCLCISHTFFPFVLSNLPAASLVSSCNIRA